MRRRRRRQRGQRSSQRRRSLSALIIFVSIDVFSADTAAVSQIPSQTLRNVESSTSCNSCTTFGQRSVVYFPLVCRSGVSDEDADRAKVAVGRCRRRRAGVRCGIAHKAGQRQQPSLASVGGGMAAGAALAHPRAADPRVRPIFSTICHVNIPMTHASCNEPESASMQPACRERAARAELVEGFGTGSVDTLPSQVGGQAARPPAYGVSGRGLRPTPFGVGTWEYILAHPL